MIPNFFSKRPIPEKLPEEMLVVAQQLSKAKSAEECLKMAYDILTAKYHGGHIMTVLRFFDLYRTNPAVLWRRHSFMHCTNLNYLMRILLVKSGWFGERDIEPKLTLIWFVSPHQYLRVRLDETRVANIDLWAKVYGLPYGDYAHGFHSRGL